MKIWIDADAAPRDVKDLVFRAALRLELDTVMVANRRMRAPPGNRFVGAVWVEGGPDVADEYIAENADAGDVAVTADILLAAILVEKGLFVLDPRGERYTEETVRERLSIRDFMDSLREVGVQTGGPNAYGPRDRQAFASGLNQVLEAAMRQGR